MDTVVEFFLRVTWVLIKSPYPSICYIFDRNYRKKVKVENDNSMIEILAFLFRDLIILSGVVICLVTIMIFIK